MLRSMCTDQNLEDLPQQDLNMDRHRIGMTRHLFPSKPYVLVDARHESQVLLLLSVLRNAVYGGKLSLTLKSHCCSMKL